MGHSKVASGQISGSGSSLAASLICLRFGMNLGALRGPLMELVLEPEEGELDCFGGMLE